MENNNVKKSFVRNEGTYGYSSKYELGVFPIGWLILELYHRFIANISYDTYRNAMWVLVLLLFTVQGFAINDYKRRDKSSTNGPFVEDGIIK